MSETEYVLKVYPIDWLISWCWALYWQHFTIIMTCVILCAFFHMFVSWFTSHSRFFFNRRTGEGLQTLTYTRQSWSLDSEGSLACHTYWDTGHPLIWSSLRNRDTHTYCRVFSRGAVTTCFNNLGLSCLWIETRSSAGEANVLPLCHRVYKSTIQQFVRFL